MLERLAAGGMGTVYVAQQLSTGKRRALKVMHAQYEGDERARERFIQEARVGASIDSDHIVEMVGAGIDDETNTPWIAMELLSGQDLKQRVGERGQLPREEVLEICRQLCHALGEAHQRGLVHRDLKPENLCLAKARREGVPCTVKRLEFGIAKLVQENQTQASHTQAVGSPRWMAPEQAERGARISPATDVWALGLIVFNLLTGRCYWRTANSAAPSVMQQMCEVIMDPIEPASARAEEYGQGPALPPGFDEWFARCVNRDVAARFPDATAAMNGLSGVLSTASGTQRRSLKPTSQRPRADFRLDEPLPRDAPFSLQGNAPASSMPPPDTSRSMTPPELSRSGAPLAAPVGVGADHSRSMTPPPSGATEVSAPLPAVEPPGPPARSRGLIVVVAASVLTLAGVTAVALTRRSGPVAPPTPTVAPVVADVPVAPPPTPPPVALADADAAVALTVDAGVAPTVVVVDAGAAPTAQALVPAPDSHGRNPPRAGQGRVGGRSRGERAGRARLPGDRAHADARAARGVRRVLRARHRGQREHQRLGRHLVSGRQRRTPLGREHARTVRRPEVGRCIADSVRGMSLPPPPSGTSAIVHSIQFSRRFDPPPEPAPTPTPAAEPAPAADPTPTAN
ncbi:MAG: protein kinase [Polyangiales bacterium]